MDASRQLAASTRTFHSPSDLTAGDLLVWDAPTHPLFERSRWPLDIDYDRVKPSLFNGTSTMADLVNGNGEKVPVTRGPRAYNKVTDGERKQVQCRLRQLAPMIQTNTSKGLPLSVCGQCARCRNIRRDCFPGPGSAIYVADSMYTGLDPAVTSLLSSADVKRRQIHFGSVLCHEAAHAACHAARDIVSFFFEDSAADEIGEEFEARIFGAVPNGHFKSSTIHWVQWPSRQMVKAYKPARPCKDFESLPSATTRWVMTDADATRLMDPVTWDHLYPTIGHIAMIPELVEAAIERGWKNNESLPVPSSIVDIYRDQ